MYKKSITACMALAAFVAFAVMPATASATNDPTLTDAGGHVAVGSKIKGTQVGISRLYETNGPDVQLECTTGELTGEVKKNSGGTVEGEITLATFGGTGGQAAGEPKPECTGSFANPSVTASTPMCVRSTPTMLTDEFQVTGGACGTPGKVAFTIAVTGLTPCVYNSTGPLVGTAPTDPSELIVSIEPTQTNGFTKVSGSFFCPHSSELEMKVTLETDTTPTKTADPLTVS